MLSTAATHSVPIHCGIAYQDALEPSGGFNKGVDCEAQFNQAKALKGEGASGRGSEGPCSARRARPRSGRVQRGGKPARRSRLHVEAIRASGLSNRSAQIWLAFSAR